MNHLNFNVGKECDHVIIEFKMEFFWKNQISS